MTEIPTGKETGSVFNKWIANFSETGKVSDIDSQIVKAALEECGANFPPKEELLVLGEYTNKAKRPGLDKVWGEERVDKFKEWTSDFIDSYEKSTGKLLPELKPSGIKNSGMLQFFGELTAFASGVMPFEKFKEYSEARAFNGEMWQKDRKDERIRVKVPTSDEPILLSSFPQEFPKIAWVKVQTLK